MIIVQILMTSFLYLIVVYTDEEEADNFKTIISNLINMRQKVLSDIKQGNVNLPEDLVEKIQDLGIESVLDAYEERLEKMFMLILEGIPLDLNTELHYS